MRKIAIAAAAVSAAVLAGGFAASAQASSPAPKPKAHQTKPADECADVPFGTNGKAPHGGGLPVIIDGEVDETGGGFGTAKPAPDGALVVVRDKGARHAKRQPDVACFGFGTTGKGGAGGQNVVGVIGVNR